MRRSHLTVFAAVSFAALVGMSSYTQAASSSGANLGFLKQQDQWKVGTVSATGTSSYCAMVGKYDKQAVLAFALNPEGMGSVAMDFREDLFEAGAEYQVSMKATGMRTRSFSARATSERSVVVQVGQDDGFFTGLSGNGNLGISMKGMEVTFSMREFASSYKNLVTCTSQLEKPKNEGPQVSAVKVKRVEEQALAPIDREVEKLAEERGQVVKANKEVERLQDQVASKYSSFDQMEDQLEKEAGAEQDRTTQKIAELDARKAELTSRIEEERKLSRELAEAKEKNERKLVAAMGGRSPSLASAPVIAAPTGLAAQSLEQQQVVAARLNAKQVEIAALEAEKKRAAEKNLADFRASQQALADKTAQLEKERAAFESQKTQTAALESARAARVANESRMAELAKLDADRKRAEEDNNRKLSDMQASYQSRLASLEAERDSLKKQVETASTGKDMQVASLTDQLASARKDKTDAELRFQAADRQNKLLQASLSTKESELAQKSGSAQELASVRAELNALKNGQSATVASLQKQLDDRTAQYDTLRKQFDGQQADLAMMQAGQAKAGNEMSARLASASAELAQKQLAVTQLENELHSVQAARDAETTRAQKAQADLDAARQQIADLRQGLGGDQQRLASLKADLDAQKVALESKAAELAAETDRLGKERLELTSLRDKLSQSGATSAGSISDGRQKIGSISTGVSYDDAGIRTLKADLERKQADLERQALAQAQQSEWIESEKAKLAAQKSGAPVESLMASERAELADARSKIKALEQRLGQSQQSLATADAAGQENRAVMGAANALAMSEIEQRAADLDKEALRSAQIEIAKLKTQNASLEKKLSNRVSREAVADNAVAQQMNASEPAAGGDATDLPIPADVQAEDPKPSFFGSWFGGHSYGYNKAQSAKTQSSKQVEKSVAQAAEKVTSASVSAANVSSASANNSYQVKAVAAGDKNNFAVPAVPALPVTEEKMDVMSGMEPIGAPVVSAVPAFAPSVPSSAAAVGQVASSSGGTKNRAAAFLDRIMSYHRPGAQPVPSTSENEHVFDVTDQIVASSASVPSSEPSVARETFDKSDKKVDIRKKDIVSERPQIAAVQNNAAVSVKPDAKADIMWAQQPVVAAAPVIQPVTENVADVTADVPSRLAKIEAAAGTPVTRTVERPSFVPEMASLRSLPPVKAESSQPVVAAISSVPVPAPAVKQEAPTPAKQEMKPVASAQPVMPVAAAKPVALRSLLDQAGLKGVSIAQGDAEPGETVRQWNSGKISGMYEKLPVKAGNFDEQVQAYLSRYRDDCPQGLKSSVGGSQAGAGGTMAIADVSCTTPGNTYTTSFVFIENGAGFSTVLHSGYPEEAAKVRSLADNVAYALGASSGIVEDDLPEVRKAEAKSPISVTAPAPRNLQYRFNIKTDDNSDANQKPVDLNDINTVVVE